VRKTISAAAKLGVTLDTTQDLEDRRSPWH
jgi:hypothetical protein